MPSRCPDRHIFRRSVASTIGAVFVLTSIAATGARADPGDTIDGRYSGGGVQTAGKTLELDVTGRGGTTDNATAVTLNITATQPAGPGFATVYPCGTTRPEASTINFTAGTTIANAVTTKVGTNGNVCIYTQQQTHLVIDVNGYYTPTNNPATDYRPLTPARLLDTRPNYPTIDGSASGGGVQTAGKTLELDVTGRGGTTDNATAVTLNITATQPAGPGFATVYPCGTTRPEASTINFTAGTTIANAVTTKVGTNGNVCIYTQQQTHLVIDVNGYYTPTNNPATDYRPLTPARLLDTRPNYPTIDGSASGGGVQTAGKTLELDVTGRGGTTDNATAVTLNITATQPAGPGFATVYPCGTTRPEASTINFTAGTTIANAVTTKVGTNGNVCIYTQQQTHLVIDVNGYYTPTNNPTTDYRPLTPARLLDTRSQRTAGANTGCRRRDTFAGSAQRTARRRTVSGRLRWTPPCRHRRPPGRRRWHGRGFRHSGAGYAENIAWHSSTSMTPPVAATTLHNMWVDSPGHHANMLDPRWTRVGIGLELTGSGWYGTHMFA